MSTDLGKGVRLEGNKIIYTSPRGTVTVQQKIKRRSSPEINIQKEWTVAPGVHLGIHGQAKGKDKNINIRGKVTFSQGGGVRKRLRENINRLPTKLQTYADLAIEAGSAKERDMHIKFLENKKIGNRNYWEVLSATDKHYQDMKNRKFK